MANRSGRAGSITERDQHLFRFLFESKVATSEQLHRALFVGTNQQAAYRRLAKLTESGWLKRNGFSAVGGLKNVFSITEKSYQKYVVQEGVNDRNHEFLSEAIGHDTALVDIRWSLESRSLVRRFYSENYLQSSCELIRADDFCDVVALKSDAVLEFVAGDHCFRVPIEYEATLKERTRNEKKILDYYVRYPGKAVIFICREAGIANALRKTDESISKEFSPKLYFAMLSDVVSQVGKITFVSSNQKKQIVL